MAKAKPPPVPSVNLGAWVPACGPVSRRDVAELARVVGRARRAAGDVEGASWATRYADHLEGRGVPRRPRSWRAVDMAPAFGGRL